MAEGVVKELALTGSNQIHYVYGDQEFILGTAGEEDFNSAELTDVLCADGSRAILFNGQYYLTDENGAILLQQQDGSDEATECLVQNSADTFIIGNSRLAPGDTSNIFEGEIVQLVDAGSASDGQQVIYYTSEDGATTATADTSSVSQFLTDDTLEGIQDEDGNIYPCKRIKLENEFYELDDYWQQQHQQGAPLLTAAPQELTDDNKVRYTLLEDGQGYQLCAFDVNATEAQDNEVGTTDSILSTGADAITETTVTTATTTNTTTTTNDNNNEDSNGSSEELLDLNRITGRNLITGQTVTLHSYMEKLKKKLNINNITAYCKNQTAANSKETESGSGTTDKSQLKDLLDKKIPLGTTKTGKKIFAKVIQVGKKIMAEDLDDESYLAPAPNQNVGGANEEVDNDETPPSAELPTSKDAPSKSLQITSDEPKIFVKRSPVSRESFEQISKTLGGVMEMESVRRKLENKNIVVKLIEKKYLNAENTFVKNTSYCYGYMEKEFIENTTGEFVERWKFLSDNDTQNVLLGEHTVINEENGDGLNNTLKRSTKFPLTTSLTISISYGKAGNKTIRVNLSSSPGNVCGICSQHFKNTIQLRAHMNSIHNTDTVPVVCEICTKQFVDLQKYEEHKLLHIEEGKLLACNQCDKCFTSIQRLNKHLSLIHDIYLRPLECTVCNLRCTSEWTLKKHLLIHTGIKPFKCDICHKQFLSQYDVNFHRKIHFPDKHFSCNICTRTFSRHSNLLRHAEIHKGSGALYKCDICCCSYNYISSLTRHMVQNHINVKKTKTVCGSATENEEEGEEEC